jgi:hypothetical protein
MQGFLFGGPVPAENFGARLGEMDVLKLAGFDRKSGTDGSGKPALA